ncbi:Putative ribonuclease H protein At1g65750 [Linum perenne]
METSVLPIATCELIDKRIHEFVWGSTDEERKTHLVSWEQICKPKAFGGLGLRLSRHLNSAFMAKLAFLFMQKPELLWVRVLHTKYFREVNGVLRLRSKSSQSSLWRGISKAWPVMVEGSRVGIGNGRDTLFWTGCWLDSGTKLIDRAVYDLEDLDIDATISEFVTGDGSWDLPRIRRYVDEDTIKEIIGMLPPSMDRGEDSWVWGYESIGKFSIRSAYELVVRPSNPRPEAAWDRIWNWGGPSRIQFFPWLVSHEMLLTNLERKRRHMSQDSSCPRCGHSEESILHILRDYPFAGRVAIALLSNEADPYHHHSGEVRAFRNLMLRDWEVTLNHIFREGNQAADFLAGVGHNLPPGFHLFPISDCNLGYFVRRDSMGISEPRDIPS